MTYALVFYPDYRAANPYQTLLYDHAGRDLHPRHGTITDAADLQRHRGVGSRVIFHLHWEDAVYRNEASEPAAWQAAQRFLHELEAFLDAGGQLAWTLHNEAPHDGRYLAVHTQLCAKLAVLADVVHVHSLAAAGFARRRLGIEPARLALVPHGSYLSLYPSLGQPIAASRTALGMGDARRVLLLFGRLGRYKGGAELLGAFARIPDPGLWLVVAGKQIDPLAGLLAELPAEARSRVVVLDRFVSDAELPQLFHASDMVALPYTASLTSGSAILALSQTRPVLAPALPGLAELLADGVEALLYRPETADGLRAALLRFLALDPMQLSAMQQAARAKAELLDWRSSGLLLDGVYARLLATLRPQRAPAAADPAPAQSAPAPTPASTVHPLRPVAADAA
jgi:glycosyltransferase involved in cell wall biosynthesis